MSAVRLAEAAPREVAVLLVDDSIVARAALGRMLGEAAGVEVVAAVDSAAAAIRWLQHGRVDVVLLDIAMPGRDGLEALPDLLAAGQGAHILIVSSFATTGAAATVRALALGAADTLEKPSAGALGREFGAVLAERVRRLGCAASGNGPNPLVTLRAASDMPPEVLAIAGSTGGIGALAALLASLPARLSLPILITQHLPEAFLASFSAQVASMAQRPALVATEGQRLLPGMILIAGGSGHLTVRRDRRDTRIMLSDEVAPALCRPAADPMFASVARAFGPASLGVVLSGMGRDGVQGAAAIAEVGGTMLAQDAASSTIWGMPGAVARGGLASFVASPTALGRWVAARIAA